MGLPEGAVVVAVGDVRHSSGALAWGAEAAQREERPLVLVHAAGHLPRGLSYAERHGLRPSLLASGHEVIDDALRLVAVAAPGLPAERLVRLVDPTSFLRDLREEAHVVVVGPETWAAGGAEVLAGAESATRPAAATPQAPVVVVGRRLPSAVTTHVLAATATSVAPGDVLDFAFDSAFCRGGDLEVVVRRDRTPGAALPHRATSGAGTATADATADVARWLERHLSEDGAVPAEVTVSDAPGSRYLLGRSAHASLAVLGRAHVGPSSVGTRDLGLRLVQRMRCPVAVVTGAARPAIA